MEIMSVSVSVQSGSSYSLPPEAQKAGLEKRINAAELKLGRLDKEDALEKSKPPGSPIPGILQARTLEWVAISFSNA